MRTQIVQRAYDNLLPGGHFEAQELLCLPQCDDGTLPCRGGGGDGSSALARWMGEVKAASDAADRRLFVGPELKGWLEAVGFEDVREAVYRIPVNGWPRGGALKHVGQMWQRNLLAGLSGFSLGLLNRVGGRTVEDIEVSLFDMLAWLVSFSDMFLSGLSGGCEEGTV